MGLLSFYKKQYWKKIKLRTPPFVPKEPIDNEERREKLARQWALIMGGTQIGDSGMVVEVTNVKEILDGEDEWRELNERQGCWETAEAKKLRHYNALPWFHKFWLFLTRS